MKTMKIEDIMTRDVKTCRPGETLADAARIMWDHDCGCVPVVNQRNEVIGMLTDRDVCMAAYTQGRPLVDIPVKDAMSRNVFGVGPGDTIELAEAMMKRHQIRRLPVLGFEKQLVGILSLNDVVISAVNKDLHRVEGMTPAAIEETLAAVCRHREPIVVATA